MMHMMNTPDPASDHKVLTWAVRSLPRRMTLLDFLAEVDSLCSAPAYNFVLLPWECRKMMNMGHAFISFVTSAHAQEFVNAFQKRSPASKLSQCGIRCASVQGIAQNVASCAISLLCTQKSLEGDGSNDDCLLILDSFRRRVSLPTALEEMCCEQMIRSLWQKKHGSHGVNLGMDLSPAGLIKALGSVSKRPPCSPNKPAAIKPMKAPKGRRASMKVADMYTSMDSMGTLAVSSHMHGAFPESARMQSNGAHQVELQEFTVRAHEMRTARQFENGTPLSEPSWKLNLLGPRPQFKESITYQRMSSQTPHLYQADCGSNQVRLPSNTVTAHNTGNTKKRDSRARPLEIHREFHPVEQSLHSMPLFVNLPVLACATAYQMSPDEGQVPLPRFVPDV